MYGMRDDLLSRIEIAVAVGLTRLNARHSDSSSKVGCFNASPYFVKKTVKDSADNPGLSEGLGPSSFGNGIGVVIAICSSCVRTRPVLVSSKGTLVAAIGGLLQAP